eukprot:3875223-Amphidinium_carterae.1
MRRNQIIYPWKNPFQQSSNPLCFEGHSAYLTNHKVASNMMALMLAKCCMIQQHEVGNGSSDVETEVSASRDQFSHLASY